ncbi:hypothetical protein BJX68DRAFT_206741 [Aspergillus pseudodeflectus]|uniref:Uncharacterized protein n=1 Tax=Aspergillus pseudodeflectus TaxID=176178 RepID=A0ABR4KVH4_9EURO
MSSVLQIHTLLLTIRRLPLRSLRHSDPDHYHFFNISRRISLDLLIRTLLLTIVLLVLSHPHDICSFQLQTSLFELHFASTVPLIPSVSRPITAVRTYFLGGQRDLWRVAI